MSRTEASGSVQKYASQPCSSRTSTTRITPPAGFQVARKLFTVLLTFCWYCQQVTASHPRA